MVTKSDHFGSSFQDIWMVIHLFRDVRIDWSFGWSLLCVNVSVYQLVCSKSLFLILSCTKNK